MCHRSVTLILLDDDDNDDDDTKGVSVTGL